MNCNLWVAGFCLLVLVHGWLLWMLRAQQRLLRQLMGVLQTAPLQAAAVKPLPVAGSTFVPSDAEVAARERQLMATSRQRAQAVAQDAHQKLIRTFRPGSTA